MKPIGSKELREIQLALLDQISSFCERTSLRWFLAFGSLLGAIRHKGYIPWDDDLDIMMPRPDYDRFVHTFQSSARPYVRIVSMETDPRYGLPFAKIHDSRTLVVEHRYRDDSFGVYVDVFPMDGIESTRQAKSVLFLKRFLNAKKAKNLDSRSFAKRIAIFASKIPLLLISEHSILRAMDRAMRRVPFDNASALSVLCSVEAPRMRIPPEWIRSVRLASFENRLCPIPKNAELVLSQCYGDFWTLPPEDQRHSHHDAGAFWKN